MQKQLIQKLHKNFEDYRHENDGVEYWFARELQELLEYTEWRNFGKVIAKAKESCKNANQKISDHFVDINKMVIIGSKAQKQIKDIMLTRYASYLIAQNGDPGKEIIAFAQTYFAVQTRKQEILIERMQLEERVQARNKLKVTEAKLSKNIYERGVDHMGFGRIRSQGDSALFGGVNTAKMKKRLNVKSGPLANKLPTITIKAKDFATELTNFNVEKKDMHGEPKITTEHIKNNLDVRGVLDKQGIKPEELPPAEDTQKIERKLKKQKKQLNKLSKIAIGKKK